jgi:hypothetical protein
MKTFYEFRVSEFIVESEELNEGFFDKIFSVFGKLGALFKNPDALRKSVETAVTSAGDKSDKFIPKTVKAGETVMIMMGDGKNSAMDFAFSFTKLADLQDGSGIFQLSGSSNPVMLKALVGTDKVEELSKNPVLAMVAPTGMEKGKPVTMKLFKNMLPGGKDYVTKTLMMGATTATEVEKVMAKNK